MNNNNSTNKFTHNNCKKIASEASSTIEINAPCDIIQTQGALISIVELASLAIFLQLLCVNLFVELLLFMNIII